MRRIVVALVACSLVFTLVGCGGGGDDPAADTAATDATTTPVVAPVAGEPVEPDRSPVESGYPAAFPAIVSTETPASIQQKLDDGRPMAIFFYDGTQLVTKDQRAELDAALVEYRGLIDLITFNLASSTDADAQVAALVAKDLGVSGSPYILLVDGNGFVTWRFKGYVDSEIIAREVLRATE